MKNKFYITGIIAILLGYAGIGGIAHALPVLVIDDQYTNTNPSVGTSISSSNTFTSTAITGGDIIYTVNTGSVAVGFAPLPIFFGGPETVGSMFMSFDTIIGNLYEVDFDILQIGNSSTHSINVSAFDGVGIGGAVLGNSGNVGINSTGNFTFSAASIKTTIQMLGVLGTPNSSSDIGFDNFQVSTVAVPEPASFALLGMGLCVMGISAVRRRWKNESTRLFRRFFCLSQAASADSSNWR